MDKSVLIFALSTLVLLVVLVLARSVHPAKNKSGVGFNGFAKQVESPPELRVATFNIQTGKSLQGKRDIEVSAAALQSVHLAAVQEVYGAG